MNRLLLAAPLALLAAVPLAHGEPLTLFRAVAIAPDGARIASIETRDVPVDGQPPARLVIRDLAGHAAAVIPECPAGARTCQPSSPSWNHAGTVLAFLVDAGAGSAIETVGRAGGRAHLLLAFAGPLDDLRYGPGDRLAVLATADATKQVGRTEAAAPVEGEVGTRFDEQRIATVDGRSGAAASLRFVSPADLYVYQYDWRPGGSGFVGTAAHGDGDSNWWIAGLYAFRADGAARLLFQPGPREQMADPAVSPDGAAVAFVGGWMSDFGSTGGDAFSLALRPGAQPVDLTPGLPATVTSLSWQCSPGRLTATELAGGETRVAVLDASDPTSARDVAAAPPGPAASSAPSGPDTSGAASGSGAPNAASGPDTSGAASGHDAPETPSGHDTARFLRRDPRTLTAGGWNDGLSCAAGHAATVASDFATPPAILAGTPAVLHSVTDVNGAAPPFTGTARSLAWTVDGLPVQGWLLTPAGGPAGLRRPLVVDVHGGPEAAAEPLFPAAGSDVRAFLARGWDVLEPNYRGSYGEGERFASASIGDLGGGDWRDVLAGVDAAGRATPIDEGRLAITGGSYGGYMAMWAVTQTHRFRAAMADAGVSDWLSIEGEAPQAGSDQVNFGGSVYDNAAPYLRASPITHMRGVVTPTLIIVGDRDLECPEPQSEEFHTAMLAMGAPTSFVVYRDEGHGFVREADRRDRQRRTIDWFARWFALPAGVTPRG